jgi:hypothetical protein
MRGSRPIRLVVVLYLGGFRGSARDVRKEEREDRILLLNLTPRKVLGGRTPLEAFLGKSVALIT